MRDVGSAITWQVITRISSYDLIRRMNGPALIEILRGARANRRVSQLELALSLGVSQRHVSFVESGRAKPSRELLLAWVRELETPMEQCNAALLAAGYAPAYSSADLSETALVPAVTALRLLLSSHDPWPAFVLDAHWNLIDLNSGARKLASLLSDGSGATPEGGATLTSLNMLDALAASGGFARHITNLQEVGSALIARLRRETRAIPALAQRTQLVEDMVKARLGSTALVAGEYPPRTPLLVTKFDTPLGPLAFFSMFTTFGTPQDISLASLRVELLFAADAATGDLWHKPVA